MNKHNILMTLLITAALLMTGCALQDTGHTTGERTTSADSGTAGEVKLSFFENEQLSRSLSTVRNEISDARTVVVTINNAQGTPVFTRKPLTLYYIGGSFVSESLSLAPGNYTMEAFFVADKDSKIIYAAPKKGSPKAHLVKKSLPIPFTVTRDVVTNVSVEVVSAKECKPEDFGYASFTFKVVKSFCFLVTAQVYDKVTGKVVTTTANIAVASGKTALYTKELAAKTEKIEINDGYGTYQVTITKEGYKPYTKQFTNDELKDYFTLPLIVFLEPKFAVAKVQDIPTSGAHGWTSFTIEGSHYLAIANFYNDSTRKIKSRIYKWNGKSFELFQDIPTTGAVDWEYFSIGDTHYLAVANYHNDTTFNFNSQIYKWNGTKFEPFQAIPTSGAFDWNYFSIGKTHFLAIANQRNGKTQNINSQIYKWSGTKFEPFQAIPTIGALAWESFSIEGTHYLAVANYKSDKTFTVNSQIYKWNGTKFESFQTIPTNGARVWEHFSIDGTHFLAIANQRTSTSYNINSYIYKWNGTSFKQFQVIPGNGALYWKHFSIGGSHYLALANYYNGTTRNINSAVYKWDGSSFKKTLDIPTSGAAEWSFFTIGKVHYLAVSNYYNDKTRNLNSQIYEITNF